jgi:hypothetical protein
MLNPIGNGNNLQQAHQRKSDTTDAAQGLLHFFILPHLLGGVPGPCIQATT